MKLKKNVLTIALSVAALAFVTLFSSCMKNNNGGNNSEPQGVLSVLHAAPGFEGLDVYLNKNKITTNGTLNYFNGGSLRVTPADYTISFIFPVSGDTVASKQDSLGANYYSAILYDTASQVKLMLIEDQFEQSQNSGDAFLRFLQLSPGSDVVTVYAGKDVYASSRTFADNAGNASLSKFKPLSAGSYSFTAVDAQGDTLGHIEDKTLQGGGAYTLYLSGYKGAPKDSLKQTLNLIQTF